MIFPLLGDALSRWLRVSVPGSFWGFLMLSLALGVLREVPRALSSASAWLLNHLALFLLPSLVAAVVGLRFVADAMLLLVVTGLLVTVLMAVGGSLVVSALKDRQESVDDA
ncbi:CidA/LrgA family protein [Hydrogenophaga flava]|uniref:CidA/LrgA family protein n=1 Tax=Hydrogenophaga flava TaxID=65657 RepID=UPI001FE117D7|nr:CidA/LrgA family protein [Hydrogenophaga flava]